MMVKNNTHGKSARKEAERKLWEERFLVWLRLGPERTLQQTWRVSCRVPEHTPNDAMPAIWAKMARRHKWQELARAHDQGAGIIAAHLRGGSSSSDKFDLSAEAIDGRERARRKERTLLVLLQQTLSALGAARLDTLDTEVARAMLPANRLLLVALNNILIADRGEAVPGGLAAESHADDDLFSATTWHAALEKARQQLEKRAGFVLPAANEMIRPPRISSQNAARESAPRTGFLVCIGDDPLLKIDLAMFRAVKQETGIHFHRIRDVTSVLLESHLRRERELGRPVRYVHLACHGGSDGIVLADGIVDGNWLSTHLQGVEVLLLAACNGEMLADWLAVVPCVVSFSDAISHADAAVVTRAFWRIIARGGSADDAIAEAMRRAQPHVSEFVVKHW